MTRTKFASIAIHFATLEDPRVSHTQHHPLINVVGVAVDLLTDWSRLLRGPAYLAFRGDDGTVAPPHASSIFGRYTKN